MGAVDQFDQVMRGDFDVVSQKVMKWTKRYFDIIFGMTVNNAYLIYRGVNKDSPTRRLCHNDFHQLLAIQLINNPYKEDRRPQNLRFF